MDKKVNVGVVGTSWFADVMHLQSLRSHPRARIQAICGRNRGRAEEMAAKHSIPNVFTNYREMIRSSALDAVVVVVPDDLHHPVTMAALDAGLHVLCEKPLALTAADARAMYEKAQSAGVTHLTNFTNHWRPWYRYVKELIEQGAIGSCYHCSFEHLGSYGRGKSYAWRFDRTRSCGILGDLGSHMIDLSRWFVGDLAEVCADLATFVQRDPPSGGTLEPANDAAVLSLRFDGGPRGTIRVSAVAQTGERGQTQRIALHGERGAIEVDATTFDAEVRIIGQQGRIEAVTVPDRFWGNVDKSMPPKERFFHVLTTQPVAGRLFIDAILDGSQVVPSLRDGLEAQLVIEAAFQSQEEARWVRVGSP